MTTAAELGMASLLLPSGQEIWLRKASFASQATAARDLAPLARQLAGNATSTLGPGEPMDPAHPEEGEPRRWAYQPGFNLRPQPRSTESVSFEALRALADNYDVARLAIEARKDEMRGLEWRIQPKAIDGQKREEAKRRAEGLAGAVVDATAFFKTPNQEDFWAIWLTQWLEDLFVIDAATIYCRPRRDGGLHSLDVIDGSTIRPIIDVYGRQPQPPAAAFGQVIYGVTWGEYTSDELIYSPYWQRSRSAYGHPPLEWIMLAVNRALRRQTIDLSMYTEGTLPVGFYKVPETWNDTQIAELQEIFDGILAGNDLQRARVRFVPGGQGTGLEQVHQEPKTEVEEWLLYITCAAFGVQPTDIGFQPRGAGLGGAGFMDAQADAKKSRATKPLANHIKGIIDEVLAERMEQPELELVFPGLEDAEDIVKQAQADEIYVRIGKDSVDELRERDDQDPIGLGHYVMGSPTLVEDILDPPDPVVPVGEDGRPLQMPFGMTQPGGPPKPDEEADPADKGDEDLEDDVAKIAGELRRWERKAVRAVKAGRRADVPFTSDVLGELATDVGQALAKASSVPAVRRVFELAKAGASADPFASSTSASSSSSGTTTSSARASDWSTSSAIPSSPRQPYP